MSKLVSFFIILMPILSNQVNVYAAKKPTLEIKSEAPVLADC